MIVEEQHLLAAGVKDPAKWIEAVRQVAQECEINTPHRIASFLAQIGNESAGLTRFEEGLSYSADGLAGTWPNRFAVQEQDPTRPGKTRAKRNEKGKCIPSKLAEALARHPEQLANIVYANRYGNGPTESGDGFKYRGRGPKQLTFKDNYDRCGKALGLDLVSNPDQLLDPVIGMRSAGWFWTTNKLADFADKNDLKGQTIKLNGGLIGFEDRQSRYLKVLKVMGAS